MRRVLSYSTFLISGAVLFLQGMPNDEPDVIVTGCWEEVAVAYMAYLPADKHSHTSCAGPLAK